MNRLKAAFTLAMFGCVTSAFAGAGIVTTTVTALAPNVSYSTDGSKPLVTYIGYLVTVANEGGNTVNNIRFTVKPTVTDGGGVAAFKSAEGATCVPTTTPNEVQCTIGQLTAGALPSAVALFYTAPIKQVEGVVEVSLSGVTYYAEGTGGINSQPDNSIRNWGPVANVALGTPSPVNVKSSVPKSGGTFFTGDGVTTTNDKFATSVTVPGAAKYTDEASIEEREFTSYSTVDQLDQPVTLNCVNFTPCYQSAVTVPGSFQYLTIILRQDASTIGRGLKIDNVMIWYDGSDPPPESSTADGYHGYLGACPSPTTPLSDRPCIASSKYYKNKGVPGWTSDLDGDFEWTIITYKNGRLVLQ